MPAGGVAAVAVLAAAALPVAAAEWGDPVLGYSAASETGDAVPGGANNRVELPLSTGAACLDGSPYDVL